jgi:hypothetical protein
MENDNEERRRRTKTTWDFERQSLEKRVRSCIIVVKYFHAFYSKLAIS